jgi:hypothetical protein
MRITRNQVPGRLCDLCKQPLEVGTLGANYLPTTTVVRPPGVCQRVAQAAEARQCSSARLNSPTS